MQPIPGQVIPQQPAVQQQTPVQAAPAQGRIPVNSITGNEEKEWGIWTYTPAEYVTGIFVITGLVFWWFSWVFIEDLELGTAHLMQGLAYACWFGSIVTAVHSVEKALLNSKK